MPLTHKRGRTACGSYFGGRPSRNVVSTRAAACLLIAHLSRFLLAFQKSGDRRPSENYSAVGSLGLQAGLARSFCTFLTTVWIRI